MVRVKNLNGTAGKTCTHSSWLEHWKKKSNKNATKCGNSICSGAAEVGGHVKKTNPQSGEHLIIPLCSKCNNTKDKEFESSRRRARALRPLTPRGVLLVPRGCFNVLAFEVAVPG